MTTDIKIRKEEIIAGDGLNYLYKTPDKFCVNFVLGTVIRAIGHGMVVRVMTDDAEVTRVLKKLKALLKRNLLFINGEEKKKKIQILVLDRVRNDLDYWKSLFGKRVHVVAINVVGDFDLISEVVCRQINKNGVLAVTGDGKGKTTFGLGAAVVKSLKGEESIMISWLKEKKNEGLSWSIGEHFFEKKLNNKLFEIETTGLGFFGSPNMDRIKGESSYLSHRKKAYEGMSLVKNKIKEEFGGIMVLDEFVDTVKEIAGNIEYPLIDLFDARELLRVLLEKKIKVLVTGRRVTESWRDLVGESIEIKSVKHPWKNMGLSAVPGLDF